MDNAHERALLVNDLLYGKEDNVMIEFEKPYLQFSLHGFNSLKLKDNNEKIHVDNEYISRIYINDNLTEMYVELQKNITYEKYRKEICTFLDSVCFNMISQVEVDADEPYRRLELVCDDTNFNVYDSISFRESLTITRSVRASNFYETIISKENAMCEQHVLYQKIFEMLQNPNSIMCFLGLYDLLLVLVSKENDIQQKYVHIYLGKHKERYEPYLTFVKNKDGKSEDMLTHLRNEIAHCEQTNDFEKYRTIGSQIYPSMIRFLLCVLNDVICERGKS